MQFNFLNNEFRRPFFIALGLHVLVFFALFISFNSVPHHTHVAYQPPNIVKAVAVNQADVEREIKRISEEKHQAHQDELRHISQIKSQVKMAEQQRLAAEKQLQHLKHQRQKVNKKLASERRLMAKQKQQALAEKRHLAVLKKQAALAKKKLRKQKLASAKIAKRKAAKLKAKKIAMAKAAARKKADQKKKRLAELKHLRHEANAKALQEQMAQEQTRLAAEHAQVVRQEINKYQALIVSAISHHWRVPSDTKKNVYCRLLIHLGPGGVVLDVKLLKSSGNPVLDRSARTAVFKSSPLPTPKDPELFNQFRELRLTVRPDVVI